LVKRSPAFLKSPPAFFETLAGYLLCPRGIPVQSKTARENTKAGSGFNACYIPVIPCPAFLLMQLYRYPGFFSVTLQETSIFTTFAQKRCQKRRNKKL